MLLSGALNHDQCVLTQHRDDWSNHSPKEPFFSVCNPSATSLLSALTPAIEIVGFCITRDWPYIHWLGPCRRILLPVRVLLLMNRVRNLLHVQLLHTQPHTAWHITKHATWPGLRKWTLRQDYKFGIKFINQSTLVLTESLAASHTTVSKKIERHLKD